MTSLRYDMHFEKISLTFNKNSQIHHSKSIFNFKFIYFHLLIFFPNAFTLFLQVFEIDLSFMHLIIFSLFNNHLKEGIVCQLMSYQGEIETLNREEIPFSPRIVQRDLSTLP